MSSNLNRQIASKIINDMLDGRIAVEEAIRIWPESRGEELIDVSLHTLQHYLADKDVREKDLQYARWQKNELRKLATALIGEDVSLEKEYLEWSKPRFVKDILGKLFHQTKK